MSWQQRLSTIFLRKTSKMSNDLLFLQAAKADDEEIPAWKRLDIVCRKWAIQSGFEKDQEMYQKLREDYDRNVML